MKLKKQYEEISGLPSWLENAVVYQIFPDRFKKNKKSFLNNNIEFMNWENPPVLQGFRGGDLFGVIESLDYLKDIGINCIYLTNFYQQLITDIILMIISKLIQFCGNEAFDCLIKEIHERDVYSS